MLATQINVVSTEDRHQLIYDASLLLDYDATRLSGLSRSVSLFDCLRYPVAI
jgi:hypothetical protein